MKKLLLLSLLALCSCKQMERAFYEEHVAQVPAQTNVVTTYVTNTVFHPEQSNAQGGVVVPSRIESRVIPLQSYVIEPVRYETNIVVRPIVQATSEMTGVLPIPGAGVIAILLGWAFTGYATWKNAKDKRTFQKVSKALVQGIEAGREILLETPEGQKLDLKVKEELVKHQELHDVLNEVGTLVNRYTGTTH